MFKRPPRQPAAEAPVSQAAPYLKELAPGEYRWCGCGQSAQQPWCDGPREDAACTALSFTIKPRKTLQTVWLCGCRRSKTLPFCDGSHNKI